MRLFIAVPLSEQARQGARTVLDALRRCRADYKWVEPENLHLTMAFIGEASAETVPVLEKAMAQAVQGRAPFELAFREVGAFDSLERPRVLWLGVSEGAGPLRELAEALRAALDEAGLLGEQDRGRAYTAHLTLGRMRSPENMKCLKARLAKSPPQADFRTPADRLVLYESRLSAAGPVYAALAERRLSL